MKVLVTGGAGFIGSHLVEELRRHAHVALILDRHADPPIDLLQPAVFHNALEEFRPAVVIHLAAQVGRLFGEDDVRNSVRSNAEMTSIIAQACGASGTRLMYASTSEVYGDQRLDLCREDGPMVLPHNVYGLSKRWGEEVCRLYCDDLTVMRFSMPYGTGVPPGRGRAALPNILWQAHTGQPIPIHRGAERSWCWIGDTVNGIVRLMEGHHTGAWNIGRDDDARPLRDLAEYACQLTGADYSLIKDVDPPSAQTVVKRLSTSKLRSIGWRPTVEIEDGMQRVLAWVSQFDADGRRLEVEEAA